VYVVVSLENKVAPIGGVQRYSVLLCYLPRETRRYRRGNGSFSNIPSCKSVALGIRLLALRGSNVYQVLARTRNQQHIIVIEILKVGYIVASSGAIQDEGSGS
jgi:hypothetical protein